MSVKSDYTLNKIQGVYIYKDNDCIFKWTPKGNLTTFLPIELTAMRENVIQSEFYQNSIKGFRVLAFKLDNFIIVAFSDNVIQFQFLEAFVEETLVRFMNTFKVIFSSTAIIASDSLFSGFAIQIEEIFNYIRDQRIKFVRGGCQICKSEYYVCVKKDLIEKAKDYPVALVFIHRGHGMLLYIDANFKVRGVERVAISS